MPRIMDSDLSGLRDRCEEQTAAMQGKGKVVNITEVVMVQFDVWLSVISNLSMINMECRDYTGDWVQTVE